MNPKRFKTGIQKKLIVLLLLIGLIPTLIIGAIAYYTIRNELNETTSNQLQSAAIKQEQRINELLQIKREKVIQFANQFDFQITLGDYINSTTELNQQKLNSLLQDQIINTQDIQAIYVTNEEKQVISSTLSSAMGETLEGDEFSTDNASQTNINVREDPQDGTLKLFITTPATVNNQDVGYLSFVFRINDMIATIQDYTGLGETGETIIAAPTEDNNIVTLFPLRFDTEAALTTELNSLRLFTETSSIYQNVKDYRNNDVIIAPRPIGFTDWILATKINTNEAYSTITQLRDVLIAILLVSSVVIVIIALLITRYFTTPILQMSAVASQIGAGNFKARISLRRNDELGALSDSINTMGANLSNFVAHIESEKNRLAIILNNTTESILAIDKTGKILLANNAAHDLTKLNAGQIEDKNINEIFTWHRGKSEIDIDYNVPDTHIYPDIEYKDAEGSTHFVKLIVARVHDNSKSLNAQTIITIHDETQSKELENMKLDFVSMAAHELRTPLASLRGYLELISYKTGESLDKDVKHSIKQALKSTNELSGLINNLLDVTKIEHGTLAVTPEKIDLAEDIIKPAIQNLEFSAEDKNIKLNFNTNLAQTPVFADKIAIREVINNLLTNAIKYTAEGGKVSIMLSKINDVFQVQVADSGIGIPKEALPNLFTKFYRVHGGLDSGSTGTGLGLFIAKSIIERHNGTISVASKEGKGSTFSFTLPALNQEPNQDKDSISRGHRGWTTKNITR